MNTEISEIEEENKELSSGVPIPPKELKKETPKEPPKPPREPKGPPKGPTGPSKEPAKARSGGGLALLAVLFSLTALLGTAWMWWQDQSSQGTSEGRLLTEIARLESADQEAALKLREVRDQVDSLPTSGHAVDLAALEGRLRPRIADLDRLEQTASEQLALTRSLQAAAESMQARLLAAEAAVSGLAGREVDAGGELDLAEVDYLLRLANERLKLFADPVAADEVLELADMHLDAMNNPIYLGVRQEIATARQALSALKLPDYVEISNEVDSIQAALAGLPFRDEVQTAAEPELAPPTQEEGWWSKLKGAFSGLVTIRRSTDQENDRISLEDRDYVRQRIWLQLEIAHLALMRRDQQSFRHALGRVQQTLSTWFDENSVDVQTVVGQVQVLQNIEVQTDVPDINQPWATLRLIQGDRVRRAPVAPASDDAPAVKVEPVTNHAPAAEAEQVIDDVPVTETEPVNSDAPATVIEQRMDDGSATETEQVPAAEVEADSEPADDQSSAGASVEDQQ